LQISRLSAVLLHYTLSGHQLLLRKKSMIGKMAVRCGYSI
jgi:hypothetical protein